MLICCKTYAKKLRGVNMTRYIRFFSFMLCAISIFSCKTQISENPPVVNAEKPLIITNPLSAKAVVPAKCTLSAGAISKDGGMISYQWYFLADENSEKVLLDNATNNTYSAEITTIGKTGYYCVITNTIEDNGDGGTKSATAITETAWLEAINLADVIDYPVFTVQPASTYLSCQTITCTAEVSNYSPVYKWFEVDTTGENKRAVTDGWSSSSRFEPKFSEKGIKYFMCAAASYIPSNDEIPEKAVFSSITTVANTGLPTLIIDTNNVPTSKIDKDSYVLGSFRMVSEQFGTEEYTFSKVKNGENKEGIKGRGNSSWNMPKKGYNIKFDSAKSILGLPEAKKWCIIANYHDKTMLRNKYASTLGNEIFNSEWNPKFVSIDVIMNGEYRGNYLFCEKNTISENRVNIQNIEDCTEKKIKNLTYVDKNGDGEIDLNDGGFLMEIDARFDADFYFTSEKGVPFTLKDPDEITEETLEHIQATVQRAEDVLYSDDFSDNLDEDENQSKWMKYYDINSFVDWYLMNELSKNRDSVFHTSVYLYYNPTDEKLHMGPNWDFDISFGNDGETDCQNPDKFYIKNTSWISRMFEDPRFVAIVKARWNENKLALQETFAENGTLQTLADLNDISATLNFIKWPILGKYVWPNAAGYEERTSYQSEVDYMKNWISDRYTWLDTAINGL